MGVLLAALFFMNKVGHYMGIESHQHGDSTTEQRAGVLLGRQVHAHLISTAIDVIDVSAAHFWDVTRSLIWIRSQVSP